MVSAILNASKRQHKDFLLKMWKKVCWKYADLPLIKYLVIK